MRWLLWSRWSPFWACRQIYQNLWWRWQFKQWTKRQEQKETLGEAMKDGLKKGRSVRIRVK